ncbi:MAG: hypothetical protein R6T89_01840 [Candidatus Syntrophosphaera sp.]
MLDYYKLDVKCPLCGKELKDESKLLDGIPAIKLFARLGEKSGFVWLSALYGSYASESTLDIPDGTITTFICPHCMKELTTNETCNLCHAPMVDLHLFAGGKVSICSRAGCKKHSVEFEDLATAINHFYNQLEIQNSGFKDKG